jgi:hypothetical protein
MAHALANTIATSFPLAAAGPALRSFDSDEVMVALEPTNAVMASMGGTMKSSEFDPDPHLFHKRQRGEVWAVQRHNIPDAHSTIIALVQGVTVQVGHLGILSNYRNGFDSLSGKWQAPNCSPSGRSSRRRSIVLQQNH